MMYEIYWIGTICTWYFQGQCHWFESVARNLKVECAPKRCLIQTCAEDLVATFLLFGCTMKSTPLQDYPIAGEGKEISEMKSKPDDEKPVTLVPTKVEATPGDEKDTGGSKNNKPQHEDHTAPRKRRRSLRSTNVSQSSPTT